MNTSQTHWEVGIGFATGRRSFKKVLATYIYNLQESGVTDFEKIGLHFLIAYDLKYNNTKSSDYTNISPNLTDIAGEMHYLGATHIQNELRELVTDGVIDECECKLLFGSGYAGKRNIILYNALKHRLDYLLYLDDDEYPLAVTHNRQVAVWGGQHVLTTHLQHIADADITHGHHCGYISPIPHVSYSDTLCEEDFRRFIEALSNDILNWDNVRRVMQNGGVTFADTAILTTDNAAEVCEENRCKFISGGNLCINLTRPERTFPFYNPPGARGEDTFLSTCLTDRKVMRVPCYTFHDGFSTYNHLLNGVLPIRLKRIEICDDVVNRFYRACLGWVRYKPLLLYITERDSYEEKIRLMRDNLRATVPHICDYFDTDRFYHVLSELESYTKNVRRHYEQFAQAKDAWAKITTHLVR